MPRLPCCAWLFVYFIAARELFCAVAVSTENSDNTSRLRAQVIAVKFFSPKFFIRENPSGRIVGTARLIAFREPRERYQEGDAKVIAAGFIFALETLGF
jgi:hypothetical protein